MCWSSDGVAAGLELAAQGAGEADQQRALAMLGRPGAFGLRPWPLASRGAARGRVVRIPEQLADDADRGDAVGHRVVDAADQAGAAALQRDHVEPPQRPLVVEALGQDLAGERCGSPPRTSGSSPSCAGDVPVEVDLLGRDPARAPRRGPSSTRSRSRGRPPIRSATRSRSGAALRPSPPRWLEHQHLAGVTLDRVGLQAQDLDVVEAEGLGAVVSRSFAAEGNAVAVESE